MSLTQLTSHPIMKKITFILIALAVSAMTLVSCSKEEQYPSHIAGVWTYANGSTGYTGNLKIEDIVGGQYAYFELKSPSGDVHFKFDNPFTYDAVSGVGHINGKPSDGLSVAIKARKGKDKDLDVSLSRISPKETQEIFSGTFSADSGSVR